MSVWHFASRLWIGIAVAAALAVHGATGGEPDGLPPGWRQEWCEPPANYRPKQIIHGSLFRATGSDTDSDSVRQRIRALQQLGVGGVVCNMPFEDYMQRAADWDLLRTGVQTCHDLGMVVWIYDEKGYPSGSAGGLVLKRNPASEAQELAYDATRSDPFLLRPSFEFTHANNNYHAARRYANLIDPTAVADFIDVTHAAYWRHLEPFFGTTIEAAFTDEPSLLAVSLGQIPEPARRRVPIEDQPDPQVKPLPAVPWCSDLAQRYQERYQEDLLSRRQSLFTGDGPEDRRVRRQFWSLIADLVADRYFGALGRWCAEHRIASSGHSLHEESILHHVPLEGNGLRALGQMQIPGMDMLSSDPRAVTYSGWLTAALPSSAASLWGHRRCMTEVSDFQQKMSGAGPVGLPAMQATAAWQAAWGITDFTLYYGPHDRSPENMQAYCRFVGRLNALLQPARLDADVLLYYPIYDLWAEYRPVADQLTLQSQSVRAQQIVQSFMRWGQALQRSQVPFVLVDHDQLAPAQPATGGTLQLAGRDCRALVLPADVELPARARAAVDRWQAAGGTVVSGQPENGRPTAGDVLRLLAPAYRLDPPSINISLGRFHRADRRIVVVANVGTDPYHGQLHSDPRLHWLGADPQTGDVAALAGQVAGAAPLDLPPHRSLILVEVPAQP